MNLMSQNREKIINMNSLCEIEIGKVYGVNDEINIVKQYIISGKNSNLTTELGIYKTLDRAQEILNDIYAKLSENKLVYKMPKE